MGHFVFVMFILIGVSTSWAATSLSLENRYKLPAELKEISGLACAGERIFAVNDSGNGSVVFQIDRQGEIVSRWKVQARNYDWEALAYSHGRIHIGDIGNNKGKRRSVRVINVAPSKSTGGLGVYQYQNYRKLPAYQHDFDAEALAWNRAHGLVMFSKSWHTRQTHVQKLNAQTGTVDLLGHVDNIGWLVTGADWNSSRREYVLVGYRVSMFGHFAAYLATVNEDFEPTYVTRIDSGQVESVCWLNNQQLLVAEEGIGLAQAVLRHYRLNTK